MKKRVIISLLVLICFFTILMGCDPVFPQENISVVPLEPLYQGTTVEIEIIYPPSPGSIVFSWKEQNIEIISGVETIAVSGLSVTGLKPGTALIKVNATAYCEVGGEQESVYSTEVKITIE